MVLNLPCFEAPKNFFLYLFLALNTIFQLLTFVKKKFDLWDLIFFILISSAFLSTIFSGIDFAQWRGLRLFLSCALVGWFVSRSNLSIKQAKIILLLIVLSTFLTLAYGLFAYLYLHVKSDLQLNSVGHVNHSAIYLVIVMGVLFSLVASSWKDLVFYRKILSSLLVLFFIVGLIVSQSRAAVGVGFLLIVLLAFFVGRELKFKIGVLCSLFLIGLTSVILNVGVVQKESRNEQNKDILGQRDKVWNVSFEAARWHPLLGLGLNNWANIKPENIQSSLEARGEKFDKEKYLFQGHSHSIYLNTIVERGVVGFFALIGFMVTWLLFLISDYRLNKNNVETKMLWGVAFSAWFATFGIGLVNTTLHHEHGILTFLLLGIFLTCKRKKEH